MNKKIRISIILNVLFFLIIVENNLSKVSANSSLVSESYCEEHFYTRNSEYEIDDSGRFNQPLDRITTSDYDYSPIEMSQNFSMLNISIELSIKEINDGYQYIFLYNGFESTDLLLAYKEIEHSSGALNKSFQDYTINFSNISLTTLKSNDIVIRYGASGDNGDTWVNKNLCVSFYYTGMYSESIKDTSGTKIYDYIRNSEYTIDDNGRFCQPLDRITTSDYINAPLNLVNSNKYLSIGIYIDIKEINDGYQSLFLYNGTETYSKLIAEYRFNHYAGETNTTYKTYNIIFENIPIEFLYSNDIVIRYGGSGIDDDNWKNKNLKVTFLYNNTNQIITPGITYNEHIDIGEVKYFSCYLPQTMYYTIETRGSLDTYIIIDHQNESISDDDSGIDNNAKIEFLGNAGWINITLSCFRPTDYGNTKLQIRMQQAVLYGFNYGTNDINTIEDLKEPYKYLRNNFYAQRYSKNNYHSSEHILSYDSRNYTLLNSEVLFFSGHGSVGLISFPNSSLNSYQLTNMENTKLAVWSSCYSSKASNTTLSMTQASINAGAIAAIGWPETIDASSAKQFTDKLFNLLSVGYTINDACDAADNEIIWPWDSINNWEIAGNQNSVITINNPSLLSNNYKSNISNENFSNHFKFSDECKTIKMKNETRIYRTINGYLTNDYYIIDDKNNEEYNIFHSNISVDKKIVLENNYKSSTISSTLQLDNFIYNLKKSHKNIVYYIKNNFAIPIEIQTCIYINENGFELKKTYCTNLNDGTQIDYNKISIVGG